MKSYREVWEHNVRVLDLRNPAAWYAFMLSVQNANDSQGSMVYLYGEGAADVEEAVRSSPMNEAWYSVANSTLSSVADAPSDYAEYGTNGTARDWHEFVEDFNKFCI